MSDYKVIIAGGRDFSDYSLLKESADKILQKHLPEVTIVSGCASGADKLGERYAIERGLNIIKKPADWKQYGKSAGIIRNAEMADIADGLLAFWDGQSKGTKNMVDRARHKGLDVEIIAY